MKKGIFSLYAILFTLPAFAAYKDTGNVTVNLVSMWANGGLLVQTSPKHNIEGLNCESDYWLKLDKSYEGYNEMLSMALAAQMAGKKITVRANDDSGTDFCRLDRIIISQ